MKPTPHPLPRELAEGIFWLGECLVVRDGGKLKHAYNSAFLVAGDRHSALIEAGITSDVSLIFQQIDELTDRGLPDLRYAFPTHSEMAHAGGVGLVLDRYPQATAHGDVSDLHLVFPEVADRLHFADPGDRFDLGGTEIVVVESVFRDLVSSRWFFDTRRRALFPGDGFAYSHDHEDGACGCFAEEATNVDVSEGITEFAERAFHWTGFVDIEPYIARLDAVIFDELRPVLIAPTHGLPIGDPAATMPAINAGLRAMSAL
jgi:flavorubredoxin